ncbi:yojK [Symbiodinium natans]|uniref:YojK protein n=1 Tax=Symbiodinium natans TaxID=878477 RepID=A0A812QDM5_9DINO|nr:yojK [Symbiodinium natans]
MAPLASFVFPMASGHTNPALPLARRLVNLGWDVRFVSFPAFREAVEDTGALFVDGHAFNDPSTSEFVELHGFDSRLSLVVAMCSAIRLERAAEKLLGYFRETRPELVVYCPHLSAYAHLVARHLGIRSVSLLTLPGPGSMEKIAETCGLSSAEVCSLLAQNPPQLEALACLKTKLELPDLSLNTVPPLHRDHYSQLNLVTTTEVLADDWKEDAALYAAEGKTFAFVGPLIDIPGAKRCAGHSNQKEATEASETLPKRLPKLHRVCSAVDEVFPQEALEEAVAAGRQLVLVSLGTVITGDSGNHGWLARDGSAITGKEMCQSVFRAVFQALGQQTDEGPLLLVAVGPQEDALEGIDVPLNSICRNVLPQVDILRQKPVVFVTHGGQNSFMESMLVGTPLVVCPGFADQPANGAKAQAMQVGLCVDRPDKEEEVASYQTRVAEALQQVLEIPSFRDSAERVAEGLHAAGGVDRAMQLLIGNEQN